ncbi:MAG: hypothetical protein AABY15_00950 [Nanoarchaeota archaeon]
MHSLISRLFIKEGIKDFEDLSESDKETYDNWQRILSEGEITIDKMVEFCNNQIAIIEGNWKDFDNSKEKNERLIVMHTVYRTLVNVITKPKAEKEALEKYLLDLLK